MNDKLQVYEADIARLMKLSKEGIEMDETFRLTLLDQTRRIVTTRQKGHARQWTLGLAMGAAVLLVVLLIWHAFRTAPVVTPKITPGPVQVKQTPVHQTNPTFTMQGNRDKKTNMQAAVPVEHSKSPKHEPGNARLAMVPVEPHFAIIAARGPVSWDGEHKLAVGDYLNAGTEIVLQTGAKGRLSLVTRRGSELTLDANTKLTIAADAKNVTLTGGRLYCRNREHEYAAISTVAGNIALLGTIVDAATKDKHTVAVTVVQGQVRLENAHGQMLVASGKKAILNASAAPEDGETVNIASETAWYDGRDAIISCSGDIVYSIMRNHTIVEFWAMKADGSGKHRLCSFIGTSWRSGPWLPGTQSILVRTFAPIVNAPDYNRHRVIANGGVSWLESSSKWWIINVENGQEIPLGIPACYSDPSELAIAPDASKAVFHAFRHDTPEKFVSAFWVINLHTDEVKQLLNYNWENPAWSPDGKLVAASQNWNSNDGSKLLFVNPDDGSLLDIKVRGMSPVFSPDGKKVVYIDDYQGDYNDHHYHSGVGRIYILDLANTDNRILISPQNERCWGARWSPDGSRIVYVVEHETPSPVSDSLADEKRAFDIFVTDNTGTNTIKLFHTDSWIKLLAWASTGNAVYIATEKGLFLVAVDGSGVIKNLGGNSEDSLLTATEKREMEKADAVINEAAYQYVIGQMDDFQGKFREGRAAYQNAIDMLAGLAWQCPLLGLSRNDIWRYVDELTELVNRPDHELQINSCKLHLTGIGLLLAQYAEEHVNNYPADLTALSAWAGTKTYSLNNFFRTNNPDTVASMLKCPMGDAYTYSLPASGNTMKMGDVILSCPRHPDIKVIRDTGERWHEFKYLAGYSFGTGKEDEPY
jgi:hypothetical protein